MTRRKTIQVVDMFCGAGGESTGIRKAAEQLDLHVRLTAINHWERAIETHAAKIGNSVLVETAAALAETAFRGGT